jgi:hypothetical protein
MVDMGEPLYSHYHRFNGRIIREWRQPKICGGIPGREKQFTHEWSSLLFLTSHASAFTALPWTVWLISLTLLPLLALEETTKKWKDRNKYQSKSEQGINLKCKITHLYNCIRYQRRRRLRVHNWRKPERESKTNEHETCYRGKQNHVN